MILKTFKKLKAEKGAVEFVESTIVFSILMFMISLLIIITIITIKQIVKKEILYAESMDVLYENKNDNVNSRLSDLSLKENFEVKKNEGFINNSVDAFEDSSVIININRFDTLGIIRKVDFINYVYNESSKNSTISSFMSYIQSYLDAINKFRNLVK